MLIRHSPLLMLQVASKNNQSPGWMHVVQMYESFRISGPHGSRMLISVIISYSNIIDIVMVFEVLGVNLLKPIVKLNYKGLPLLVVKTITKQV